MHPTFDSTRLLEEPIIFHLLTKEAETFNKQQISSVLKLEFIILTASALLTSRFADESIISFRVDIKFLLDYGY